jgi:uncharacterized protein YnzC (UPF0291/DUF896 family)
MVTSTRKAQLIERIEELNRSARTEFLAEFEEAELQQYLTNLEMVWSDFQQQYYNTPAETVGSEQELALMAG